VRIGAAGGPPSVAALSVALAVVVGWAPAVAQVPPPIARPGDPTKTVPEKIEPPSQKGAPSVDVPAAPPGSLSDRLSRGEGVITPPKATDPEIRVPPPVTDPGNMPIIPPPGSPGNPSDVRPK
jgi:hypothetical protein